MSDLVLFQPVRAWDRNGVFAPGATAEFFEPGTTTPRTVYSDDDLTVAHPSPLVADARGVFAPVYTSGPVKVIIKDADGVTLPGGDMDPAYVAPASDAAASNVSFSPTGLIPVSNVQAAIERVETNAKNDVDGAGLTLTGNAALLANLDATNIASGFYRADMASTTGTDPASWGASELATVAMFRRSADAGVMQAWGDTAEGFYERRLEGGTWGAWYRVGGPGLAQTAWNAGTITTESAISPAKLRAAVDAYREVAVFEHQEASGTGAGATAAAARVTRPLNTEVLNEITGLALASNVLTIPPGEYVIEFECVGYGCDLFKAILRDVTGSADVAVGLSARSDNSDPSTALSTIRTRLSVETANDYRFEHWAQSVSAVGMGAAVSAGVVEVYARATITRLGDFVA